MFNRGDNNFEVLMEKQWMGSGEGSIKLGTLNLCLPFIFLMTPWTLHQKLKKVDRRSNRRDNIYELLMGKTVDGAMEKDQLNTGSLKLQSPSTSNSNTSINTGTL